MIPVIEINADGDLATLWTDQVDLYAVGRVTNVHNASTVEFHEELQTWEVVDAQTQEVVHRHPNRQRAIEWEITNFGPGGPRYKGGKNA